MDRRYEDMMMKSTSMRSRDPRVQFDRDSYLASQRGARDERANTRVELGHEPYLALRHDGRDERKNTRVELDHDPYRASWHDGRDERKNTRAELDHDPYRASWHDGRDRRTNPRVELDHDLYGASRHDDRGERPVRPGQSLSPQNALKGGRMPIATGDKSSSLERKGYEWQVGHQRVEDVQSRSPFPTDYAQKRPAMQERVLRASPPRVDLHKDYEYHEYMDTKRGCVYDDDDVGTSKEKDYSERRKSDTAGHSRLFPSAVPAEDGMVREAPRLHRDFPYPSEYRESSGSYPTLDTHMFKEENARYLDAISHERLKEGYFKDEEKYVQHSRDISYPVSSGAQFKDFGNQRMSAPGSSSNIMSSDYSGNIRNVHTLGGYSKNYDKVPETLGRNEYGKRPESDVRKNYEAGVTDTKCYEFETYASARSEGEDYLYTKLGQRGNYNPGYLSRGSLYEKMPYHAPPERSYRNSVRTDEMDTRVESLAGAEYYQRLHRTSRPQEIESIDTSGKKVVPDYMFMRRSSDKLRHTGDYMDCVHTDGDFAGRVSSNRSIPQIGGLHEDEIPDPRLDFDYGRPVKAESDRDTRKNLSEVERHVDIQRPVDGPEPRRVDERVAYDKGLKRKYRDEDVGRIGSKSMITNEWTASSGVRDYDDHEREYGSSSGLHSKKPSGYDQNRYYIEAEQMFKEIYHHKHSKDGWTSHHKPPGSRPEHFERSFKSESRYSKGYTKSESSKSYDLSHHAHQRSTYNKRPNVWTRVEHKNHGEVLVQDTVQSNPEGRLNHEPSEDSEVFKQAMQKAFLEYSYRMNENPTARKLYKEEGKAGSLFCIVCGRSSSKEFQDTRSVAAHAYMSHKVGLRAKHLGFHKAICVLMGWNTVVDSDIVTWTPQPLPPAVALAHKEDLILWPPVVVIHNISLSNSNHKEWKVINIEALEAFLRAKGFTLSKMKIVLGNPGDHSVMLVKFLGTFPGLQEAERLDKYFSERQHGRVDFENAVQRNQQDEKETEALLYGYMGIGEDMNKIDLDSKKRYSLRSKKEIHDFADGPVKP